MVVKTFRGLLADGGQERVSLQTIDGKTGYKILKFKIMPERPTNQKSENVVKIYNKLQSTIDAGITFTDSDLLAAAYLENNDSADFIGVPSVIIFDNEIFNQDIFITHDDGGGDARSCNYYIELEVIALSDHGAEFTTLKDIRSNA